MEIIFNNAVCSSITGRINSKTPWYIRGRRGHFHAAYRGVRNTDQKRAWFRLFYQELLSLQNAHYISQIILTNAERRWLEL